MNCRRCGNPLPDRGIICKFCGALMEQDQINYQSDMASKEQKRIELLSEKYGQKNNIEYRNEKENKILGLIIIIVILLFLIILAILLMQDR